MSKVAISIRIFHPAWPAQKITDLLKEQPEIERTVGDLRRTPRGRPLDGKNPETHWFKDLHYSGGSIVEAIESGLQKYATARNVFTELRMTGGRVEFFIGWFLSRSGGDGDVLPAEILKRAGELGVDLSLDIYGPDAES